MVEDDGRSDSKHRVISAGSTFFAKFVLSPAFLFAVVVLVWAGARAMAAVHEIASPLRIVTNLAAIGLAIVVAWPLARLKRVALSGTSLHVSNYLQEIVVPLSDVDSVSESEGSASRIVIAFKRRTPFGREIRFSPIGWSPPRPHPVLDELRAAVAAATHSD